MDGSSGNNTYVYMRTDGINNRAVLSDGRDLLAAINQFMRVLDNDLQPTEKGRLLDTAPIRSNPILWSLVLISDFLRSTRNHEPMV